MTSTPKNKQCNAIYTRNGDSTRNLPVTHIRCTYLLGHPSPEHSWHTLRFYEEHERERLLVEGIGHDDETPTDVIALLDSITEGRMDPYLEAILAIAHNRKRSLRGVRGFGGLR